MEDIEKKQICFYRPDTQQSCAIFDACMPAEQLEEDPRFGPLPSDMLTG
jgi:hypothetical protein